MTTVRIALAFLSLLFANSASAAREQHLCKEPAPVNALLASFGMNTHMQQGWQYEDAARTVSTLKELGITQVREAFTGLGHPGLEYAAREGIRFERTCTGGIGAEFRQTQNAFALCSSLAVTGNSSCSCP